MLLRGTYIPPHVIGNKLQLRRAKPVSFSSLRAAKNGPRRKGFRKNWQKVSACFYRTPWRTLLRKGFRKESLLKVFPYFLQKPVKNFFFFYGRGSEKSLKKESSHNFPWNRRKTLRKGSHKRFLQKLHVVFTEPRVKKFFAYKVFTCFYTTPQTLFLREGFRKETLLERIRPLSWENGTTSVGFRFLQHGVQVTKTRLSSEDRFVFRTQLYTPLATGRNWEQCYRSNLETFQKVMRIV